MHLAGFWLALIIPLNGPAMGPVTVEGSVYFAAYYNGRGFATPFGYFYSEYFERFPLIHTEELIHIEQMEALGPIFPLIYSIDPDFFEPYFKNPPPESYGLSWSEYISDLRFYNLDRMWMPDERLSRKFPQFRYTPGEGFTVMPGWVDLFKELTQ